MHWRLPSAILAAGLVACAGPVEAPPAPMRAPTSAAPVVASAPPPIASSAPLGSSTPALPSLPSKRIQSAIGGALPPYDFVASGDVDTEKFQIAISAAGKSQTILWEPDACPTCGQVAVSDDLVKLVDLNFDGYKDLLLEWSVLKTDQVCYEPHLFIPDKSLFDITAIPDPDHATSSLTLCGKAGPVVDAKARVIHTVEGHATCCDVTIWTSTWAWKKGKLVQTAQTEKTTPNTK